METTNCHDGNIWKIYASTFDYPAILVSDEIGLFSFVKSEPMSADEICGGLEVGSRVILALLAKLSTLDLLLQVDGRWSPTDDTRRYLTPGSDTYWGPMFQIAKKNTPLFSEMMKAIEFEKYGNESTHALGRSWRNGEIAPGMAVAYANGIHSQVSASAQFLANMPLFGKSKRGFDHGTGHLASSGEQGSRREVGTSARAKRRTGFLQGIQLSMLNSPLPPCARVELGVAGA